VVAQAMELQAFFWALVGKYHVTKYAESHAPGSDRLIGWSAEPDTSRICLSHLLFDHHPGTLLLTRSAGTCWGDVDLAYDQSYELLSSRHRDRICKADRFSPMRIGN
jgi:hypothetical protein